VKIAYKSLHGVQTVFIPNALGGKYANWVNGQERDVPEDEKVRWRVSDGGEIKILRAVDAILSCGPEFVVASTGVNPDYQCVQCGAATNAVAFLDPTLPRNAPSAMRPYEDEDGNTLCIPDFLAANPRHLGLHERRGVHPAIIAEARKRIDALVAPAEPVAPPEPPDAPTVAGKAAQEG
jgi:hypothetical protein